MKGKDNTQAKCKLCHKIIELSNMGLQALKSHEKEKKHVSVASNFSCFFKSSAAANNNSPNSAEEPNSKKTDSYSTGHIMQQQTLELIVSSSNKICAEIMWALHCCLNKISNNSNNGPYFKTLLKQQLSLSPWLVVSFDESLNKKTQTCQMDLLIRYWNEEKMQVEVRYWDSSFMGHSTSLDLLNHFNEKINDLNTSNVVQVSMDGPSVNLKFHNDVQSKREEHELPKLIDIGCCSLHIIHGAFKTGVEITDWEIKKTFKSCFILFHDSPARRSDFISITESSVFPLSFCATRWVEDKKVAERIISIWSSIIKIVNYWETLPKSKRPSCKSYQFVVNAVKKELSLVRFQFFSYLAGMFQPFLKLYQTDAPMLPHMNGDLVQLVKSILRMFIKSETIETCSKLTKIDLQNKEN